MKLFVGNLHYRATADDLRELCADVGPVVDIQMPPGSNGNANRGFAFVTFENEDDARRAIAVLAGTQINGRAIRLDFAIERQGRNRENRDRTRGVPRRISWR